MGTQEIYISHPTFGVVASNNCAIEALGHYEYWPVGAGLRGPTVMTDKDILHVQLTMVNITDAIVYVLIQSEQMQYVLRNEDSGIAFHAD